MNRAVHVLCRPAVAPGFRLAGIATLAAAGAEEATAALARLRADPSVGVVLIEDALHAELAAADREAEGLPALVPFPGPAWAGPEDAAEARVLEILRRAIGYRVKLR